MAKYMIQDIIPPNRKGSAGKKTTEGGKNTKKTKKEADDFRTTEILTPEKKVDTEKFEEKFDTQPQVTEIEQKISRTHTTEHSTHDNQSNDTLTSETKSANEIDQAHSAIIENLYHDSQKKPAINEEGAWPYNSATSSNENHTKTQNISKFATTSPMTSGGKWSMWIGGIIIVFILVFFGFNYFEKATILVVPKLETITIPETNTYIAHKSPENDELGFAVMKVTLDETKEIPATGTKTVITKATGKIVIFNKQTVQQRLIKNTRFESTAGKIYRINESITIPKATTKNGELVPGSLTVTIYADEAGPAFNSDPTDFSVPGLKNTPQYKLVFARSNGSIAGGASGTTKSVSDVALKEAGEELRITLESKLRAKARGDITPAQIGFDQGIIVEVGTPELISDQSTQESSATVKISGSLFMVIFDRTQLAQNIAKSVIPTYTNAKIVIGNIDTLRLKIPTMKGTELWDSETIDFKIGGDPEFIWEIDTMEIKSVVRGVPKNQFNTLMTQFTNIQSAKATLLPFWKSKFPETLDKIDIKVSSKIEESK